MNQSEALAEVESGALRPVYLLYGGELFLEEELLRAMRAAIVQPETADFNYHVVDPAPDQIPRALSIARTQPFFAERRLVVVRDCPAFQAARRSSGVEADAQDEGEPAGGGDELLISYFKQPSQAACLVFVMSQGVDSRKKVTKAAIAAGAAVECRPLKEMDCVMWAQTRAWLYQKRLTDGAARTLIEKVSTDLRLIDSELQKLALYVGEAPEISQGDVEAAVGGVAETEIYLLTEAVMLGQGPKALDLLARMLRQVDHPLQILGALAGRFRQMLMVKALTARRLSIKEGAAQAKMHPFPYEKMTGYLRNYPRDRIVQGLQRLLEADTAIKSGQDPRLVVEALVVELTGR